MDLLKLPIQVGDKVSADAAEIGFLVRGVTRLSIEAKNPLRLFGYLSGAWGLKGVAEERIRRNHPFLKIEV